MADLPSGTYLISSYAMPRSFAGRIPSSKPRAVKPTKPSKPAHVSFDDSDLSDLESMRARYTAGGVQGGAWYFDDTTDMTFLASLDDDAPWADDGAEPAPRPSGASVASDSTFDLCESSASDASSSSASPSPALSTPPSPLSPIPEMEALVMPSLSDISSLGSTSDDEETLFDRHARFVRDHTSVKKKVRTHRGRKVYARDFEDGIDPPKWVMEKQPSGRYILKTVGAPTGIKDGLLWAYDKPHVFGEKNVEQWELYPYVRTNAKGVKETYYTIEWASGGAGWIAQSDKDGAQIAVSPMSGKGLDEELWKLSLVSSFRSSA